MEYCLIINSKDRNITSNLQPLDFKIEFNSEKSNIQKIYKNVKYIGFENVLLPKYIQLNKLLMYESNIYYHTLLNFFQNNSVINIDCQYILNPQCSIQICNSNSQSINFTINENITMSYEYIINTNIINIYKPICMSGPGHNIQYILLNPCKNPFMFNTKNKDVFRYVFPKLNPDSDLYCHTRKSYIVFKNSNLIDIKKIHVQLLNSDFENIIINNLDNSTLLNNGQYSNPSYYIRHPNNPKFQIELFLNIGVFERI